MRLRDLRDLRDYKDLKRQLDKLIDSKIVIAEYYNFQYKCIRCIDTRTKIVNNIPHIKPLLISNGLIYLICPYCNSIHIHGAGSLGYRVPHCTEEFLNNTFKDYSIRKNNNYIIE